MSLMWREILYRAHGSQNVMCLFEDVVSEGFRKNPCDFLILMLGWSLTCGGSLCLIRKWGLVLWVLENPTIQSYSCWDQTNSLFCPWSASLTQFPARAVIIQWGLVPAERPWSSKRSSTRANAVPGDFTASAALVFCLWESLFMSSACGEHVKGFGLI